MWGVWVIGGGGVGRHGPIKGATKENPQRMKYNRGGCLSANNILIVDRERSLNIFRTVFGWVGV